MTNSTVAVSANYLQALEMRLGWLRWLQTSHMNKMFIQEEINDYDARFRAGIPLLHRVLEHGDTYYMNSYFCELVEHLRKNTPEDLLFDKKWLISPSGWMFIARPFPVGEELGERIDGQVVPGNRYISISAVGWTPSSQAKHHCLTLEEDGNLREDEIQDYESDKGTTFLTLYDEQNVNHHFGFGYWSLFDLQDGESLGARLKRMDTYEKRNFDQYAYPQLSSAEVNTNHEIRWLYAGFHLMAQRLAVKTELHASRALRRRLEHDAKSQPLVPIVQVISLRRMELQGVRPKPGDDHEVDWHWQWMVGKHWRRQYFPSLGQHKYIVIDSYMKGPEDKPVKPPSSRIYVARR